MWYRCDHRLSYLPYANYTSAKDTMYTSMRSRDCNYLLELAIAYYPQIVLLFRTPESQILCIWLTKLPGVPSSLVNVLDDHVTSHDHAGMSAALFGRKQYYHPVRLASTSTDISGLYDRIENRVSLRELCIQA